jgi:hypothetical protein
LVYQSLQSIIQATCQAGTASTSTAIERCLLNMQMTAPGSTVTPSFSSTEKYRTVFRPGWLVFFDFDVIRRAVLDDQYIDRLQVMIAAVVKRNLHCRNASGF